MCNSSKKKCTRTPLLGIFTVWHFLRTQHETLLKSDKQGAFGKINRMVSCVFYLWSAAFPWQPGAVGFNYHRSAEGPCCTGAAGGRQQQCLPAPLCPTAACRGAGDLSNQHTREQRQVWNGETEEKHKADDP